MFYVVKHVPEEGPGIFEKFLPRETQTIMAQSESFPDVKKDDFVLIMGGPMGVYEKDLYPFIKRELDFIKECFDKNVKILGICLGAQMIAEALGGKVFKGHVKEVGWFEIEHTFFAKNDRLFNIFPERLNVFQWHQDTFELPKEAIRLASSKNYENQAFKIGDYIYGLQYHIEVDEMVLKDWFADEELKPEYVDKSKISFIKPLAEEFFKAFISLS